MKNLKFSAVYTALMVSGLLFTPQQSVAQDCVSSTLNNGFSAENNVLLEKCTANFIGEENNNPSIRVNNGDLNITDSNINASNIKGNSLFYYSLFSANNTKGSIADSNITLNSTSGYNRAITLNDSSLDVLNSNITHNTNSNHSGNIIYTTNSTANISNYTLVSHSVDTVSPFYTNVVPISSENSTINLNNGNISVHNDSRIFYLNNKTSLNISNSHISTKVGEQDAFISLAMINSVNSSVTLDNNNFTLDNSKQLLSLKNSSSNITNTSINQTLETEENSFFAKNMINLDNSSLAISNTTINSEKGDGVFLLDNSNLTAENLNVSYSNTTRSFLFGQIANTTNKINIKDSNLSADRGIIYVNNSWDDSNEDKLTVNVNNSSINTRTLVSINDPSTFIVNDSTLSGSVSSNKLKLKLNNSSWTLNRYSEIKDINSDNSNIILDFPRVDYQYSTLNIDGNLTGNAHFTLNTDLASQNADKIVIGGTAEGNHTITVKDSGKEPNKTNGYTTLVKTNKGDAIFKLKDKDYINAGAFRYFLQKIENDWVLSQTKPAVPAETVKPTEPAKPAVPAETVKPTEPAKPAAPAETVKPTEPAKPAVPAETVKPTEPAKPAVPAETVKPTEPAKPTVPAETVKPTEPAKPTVPAETVKPTELAKPTVPAETVKPTEPAKPAVPADTTKPTDTATTTPVAPVVPQPTPVQPDDHPAVQRMLSETSNTLVSLRQAQLQLTELELSGIHQRLGELKTAEASNVWVRNHNARQERKAQSVSADSIASGFKQDTTLLQIGVDTAISDNWRAGGFVGTSRSDVDFNGEYGKGKLKGVNLGLYATFQAQNGIYADNIVKFDRLSTSGDGVESQRYNGYTLSSEIGKAFAFGEGWTVTPQAQLAWTHLSSGDNVESLSALTSRAGVRVSKAIALANGNITPFIEVNGIHTHNRHSQVRVNQYAFDVKGAGSRIETAAGVSANFTNHRLGVQLSTTNSDRLKQPLAVQVNYRYSW